MVPSDETLPVRKGWTPATQRTCTLSDAAREHLRSDARGPVVTTWANQSSLYGTLRAFSFIPMDCRGGTFAFAGDRRSIAGRGSRRTLLCFTQCGNSEDVNAPKLKGCA
jgi:hypothetical protein